MPITSLEGRTSINDLLWKANHHNAWLRFPLLKRFKPSEV
jgi:hypothetical protein